MESKTIRVALAIPSMGYCASEAYCSRLINWLHMGHLEQQQKDFQILLDVARKELDHETAIKFLKSYAEANPLYWELPDGKRFEFFFCVIGRIFTPYAREQAAKMALERECDYLFMIDDDMISPDDLFEKLYRHNVDIVAPLAFTRNYPHKPVMYSTLEGYDTVSQKPYFSNTVIYKYPKDKLVECDAVGFGAVLIKCEVLKKMPTPYFMSTNATGEDILFCYNAKKVGARVFMDTATKLGHLGAPICVDEEYVEKQRQKETPDFLKLHNEYDKYAKNGKPTMEPVFATGDQNG